MDQLKIGKFIACCRKSQNLTQAQLAEKLCVTDRAVSKWETGKCLPDISVMFLLCKEFGITINELFCGEKIDMEKDNEKNQKLLLDMANLLQQKNKLIWTSMWVIMITSIIALLVCLIAFAMLIPEGVIQIVAVVAACIVFLIPCFYALKLEVSVGAYKCKKCGHEIVPTYSQVLWAMHNGTTRYLKCPECHQRSWCKKIV